MVGTLNNGRTPLAEHDAQVAAAGLAIEEWRLARRGGGKARAQQPAPRPAATGTRCARTPCLIATRSPLLQPADALPILHARHR